MNLGRLMPSPFKMCIVVFLALLPVLACHAPVSAVPAEDGRKVWLIGWDGMAPWIVEPMIEAGKLPHLKGLRDTGCVGRFESLAPAFSPAIWTTIATGKKRRKHGVLSFWKENPTTGAETLFSALDRKAAPLWQIADDAGLTSVVVGWWATWPAETILGAIVSDRFAMSRFDIHPKATATSAPSDYLVSPPGLESELIDCLRKPADITAEEMARFTSGRIHTSGSLEMHNLLDELRIVFARDETHWCITKRLVHRENPDLLAHYVQGTDIVSHYFLKYSFPKLWEEFSSETIDSEELDRYKDTIETYYSWQDRRLGELLEYADDETVVFVLSDHGFRIGSRPKVASVSGVHGGAEAPPGLIFVSGPGIRSGHRLQGAHVLDVAPTVLSILNLPAARDQPGHVLVDAMVDPPSIEFISTYGEGYSPVPAQPGLDVDQEIIRSLKSVGYVNE